MPRLCLIRYDTEHTNAETMAGLLEKLVEVHRRHEIPASVFCCGRALDAREGDFRAFWSEVKDDPLFDVQDHSYSHVGVGYEAGKPVEELRADYERSFHAHERVFSVRPIGVSVCGTGGADGDRLKGFDETEKARQELDMLVGLGMKMINSHLIGVDESREFASYGSIGHPEVMGFPSGYSDTSWMSRREHGEPVEYILGQIAERANAGQHLPVMLHDWVAWTLGEDQELTHVVQIADQARRLGYELATHVSCLSRPELWS